jgi:hypothetical protein
MLLILLFAQYAMIRYKFIILLTGALAFNNCQKNEIPVVPNLVFNLAFDAGQARLNNFGVPVSIPVGHAAQTPVFNEMSLHYIELSQDSTTQLGKGEIVYESAVTTFGGGEAIDFENSVKAGNNKEFCRLKISTIKPGRYEYIRASASYQNYVVRYNIKGIPAVGDLVQQSGILSSFVGYNTYIKNVVPKKQILTVNANVPQGYWVFETDLLAPYDLYNKLYFGQSAGTTTVVNPLFNSSPIPSGSCVITGKLTEPLIITGDEKEDIVVKLSFSINNSFEWIDNNGNNQLDFYGTPGNPQEPVVDMGLRGLIPSIEK